MSSFILRLVAIICMLIDHVAHCFVPIGSDLYVLMRIVGRFAFPIFAFLICEGALHTGNFRKYALRLGLFSLLSEIPFDLAFNGEVIDFHSGQNVFFTLLLGLLGIGAIKELAPRIMPKLGLSEEACKNKYLCALVSSPLLVLCCLTAHWLNTDYGWAGVLIILAFYILQEHRIGAVVAMILINFIFLADMSMYNLQFYATFAALPILAYNGTPGSKKLKWAFYGFYPLHLLSIWLIGLI